MRMLRDLIGRLLGSKEGSGPKQLSEKPKAITVFGQRFSPTETPIQSTNSSRHDPYQSISSAEEWLKSPQNTHVPPDLLHPEKEGLEPVSASELMDANRIYIEQALQSFTHKHFIPDFDTQLLEFIRRVAHWMGPFPASRGHHHSNRGGLFTHSIGVAVSSLHMSVGKNVTTMSSPRERDADNLAWQLICFICGMLHDIGKLNTTAKVHALSVAHQKNSEGVFISTAAPVYSLPWQPMVEGFEGWTLSNQVQSYFLDFDLVETLPHKDFTVRYVMALVPRPLLAFIYNSSEVVRSLFEDFIRNPESAAQTPIFVVVRDADHMNVAQSMDPRRRPGSAEMGSLIIRRFNEFASEARWNLPSSAFIYAHVERETEEGNRYYGMPFFVASETAITEFIHYLTTKPLLGVSFGTHVREIVFKTLESAYVMNRIVDPLLPQQIEVPELQDFVPASAAFVRFRARDVDTVIKPIADKQRDAILQMAVIPINLRPMASVMMSAPTLSFSGTPKSTTTPSLPLTVEEGKALPAEVALRKDPMFMGELNRQFSLSLDEEQALSKIKPSQPTAVPDKPSDVNSKLAALADMNPGAGAVVSKPPSEAEDPAEPDMQAKARKKPATKPASGAKKTGTTKPEKKDGTPGSDDPKEKTQVSAPANPEEVSEPPKAKDAPSDKAVKPKAKGKPKQPPSETAAPPLAKATKAAKPASDPPQTKPGVAPDPTIILFDQTPVSMPEPSPDAADWIHAYRQLFDMPEKTAESAFWGVLWLFLRTQEKHSISAVENGKGGYALRGATIPKVFRGDMIAGIQGENLKITYVTDCWTNGPLRLDDDRFVRLFTLSKPDEGVMVLDLGPIAASLINKFHKPKDAPQDEAEAQA